MTSETSAPTIADVARSAGVSPATVSRVLNGTAPVNENTRGRVIEAIQSLGYIHTPIQTQGSTLTTGLDTVALVVTDISNPFFPELVRGVEEEAQKNRQGLLLFSTSEDPWREKQVLEMLAAQRVGGIVVCSSKIESKSLIALHERDKTPMVVVNRRLNHPGIPAILIDFEDAAYRITQHLLRLNHRKIAYLSGYNASESAMARRRGIEKALNEAGLKLQLEWCPPSFPSIEGGFQGMSALLSQPAAERPSAVIAYNDVMALGALKAIRTSRLQVPEDFSVVGFDGIEMSAHSNPPLTTIDQPRYRMGRLAMQMLLHLKLGRPVPGSGYTLLESPLVVRESTGPYRGS